MRRPMRETRAVAPGILAFIPFGAAGVSPDGEVAEFDARAGRAVGANCVDGAWMMGFVSLAVRMLS